MAESKLQEFVDTVKRPNQAAGIGYPSLFSNAAVDSGCELSGYAEFTPITLDSKSDGPNAYLESDKRRAG